MKKTIAFLLSACLVSVMALPIAACNQTTAAGDMLEGEYVLASATLGGADRTSDFQAYTATFGAEGTLRVVIGYLGSLETRNSAYRKRGDTVTETCEGKTYVYTYDAAEDALHTTYESFSDSISVTLEKRQETEEEQAVDFESILFGPDIADSKIFNYCPAILTETVNGEEIMHVWYCTNKDDGVIMDHIGYRKGVRQDDGKWVFSEQTIVLAPTPGTWDARHTCDPAVIRGEFSYGGTQYTYLMAYLGCVTEDYGQNETGIAVANAPEGPWVKVDSLNPIVPWQDDGLNDTGEWNWGTGMPALISLDGKGDVLLFYQSGTRGTGIQRWDFSDLDDPETEPAFTATLTHNGIVNSAGLSCRVNIPDFAYDPVSQRLYVCGVTNEKNPPDETTTRVNSHCLVAYIDGVESTEALCSLLQSGDYRWEMVGYVGPNDTGYERNHNPGIVRDARGFLPDPSQIAVIVSTGHNSWDNENIFTYRLRGVIIDLD